MAGVPCASIFVEGMNARSAKEVRYVNTINYVLTVESVVEVQYASIKNKNLIARSAKEARYVNITK